MKFYPQEFELQTSGKYFIAHEIEVGGAPFRGAYLNFMSSCLYGQVSICRMNHKNEVRGPRFGVLPQLYEQLRK